MLREPETPAARLRENVTSPGGTTAAALAVLRAPDGLGPLMRHAVAAAHKRAGELAGQAAPSDGQAASRNPPSQVSTWPVTKELEIRKAIASAISSGAPIRPTGDLPAYSAKIA